MTVGFLIDDGVAAGGEAFAVEGAGAGAAGDEGIVDDGDEGAGDDAALALGEVARLAPDGAAHDAPGEHAEDGACGVGVEHHRHLARGERLRAELASVPPLERPALAVSQRMAES